MDEAFSDLNYQKDTLDISENTSVTAIDEIGVEIREAKTAGRTSSQRYQQFKIGLSLSLNS